MADNGLHFPHWYWERMPDSPFVAKIPRHRPSVTTVPMKDPIYSWGYNPWWCWILYSSFLLWFNKHGMHLHNDAGGSRTPGWCQLSLCLWTPHLPRALSATCHRVPGDPPWALEHHHPGTIDSTPRKQESGRIYTREPSSNSSLKD